MAAFSAPRILVTGSTGQLGWELCRTLATQGEVIAPQRDGLDLSRPETVAAVVRALCPDLVVNPAAYTAVDKAESEPELAFAVNAQSVAAMAEACASLGAPLIHYSTDYVFDGQSSDPYGVDDSTAPTSVYGQSKLAGEQALRASSGRHLVIRTAWVYGPRGKNFLLTMLRLARERDALRVVADQFGTPTSSRLIAQATAQLLPKLLAAHAKSTLPQLCHLTAAGSTSWHGFASAIVAQGAALGLCKAVPVEPISTADYPTPAKRPAHSVLSLAVLEQNFGVHMPDWRMGLSHCLEDLAAARV